MDEAVIRYYRRLLKSGFESIGSLECPSIFLDSIGEKVRICGGIGNNYLHLYIAVVTDEIVDIKYKCMCDPTANVAVEILCKLLPGKTLEQATRLSEESFLKVLGGPSLELSKRARGLLELLGRGIARYRQVGA